MGGVARVMDVEVVHCTGGVKGVTWDTTKVVGATWSTVKVGKAGDKGVT
jgi:hypothetical protein